MSTSIPTNSTVLGRDELVFGWSSGPTGRGTFDIVWPCLFTIFVCTFTILHLNVPSAEDTVWQVLLRKVKWMVFAVVLPELVTASAFVQRVAAREGLVEMEAMRRRMSYIGDIQGGRGMADWTMKHAFYWNMGGVRILAKGEKQAYPVDASLQVLLIKYGVMSQPRVSEKEIWDKSKVDRFAKLVACMQIAWLSVQCCARAVQGLPITLLEVATVGFVIPSFATFAFWFDKPKDIDTATVIEVDMTMSEIMQRLHHVCAPGFEERDSPFDLIRPINKPSATSELVLKHSWWPGRSRFLRPADRIRNDVFALKYTIWDQLIVASVWVGYGAIHFSAWDSVFPTLTEKRLWRISASAMMGSMIASWIFGNRKFYMVFSCLSRRLAKKCRGVSDERQKVSTAQILTDTAVLLVYLVARLFIIVEVFFSLRALPRGALVTIDWMEFLPHV